MTTQNGDQDWRAPLRSLKTQVDQEKALSAARWATQNKINHNAVETARRAEQTRAALQQTQTVVGGLQTDVADMQGVLGDHRTKIDTHTTVIDAAYERLEVLKAENLSRKAEVAAVDARVDGHATRLDAHDAILNVEVNTVAVVLMSGVMGVLVAVLSYFAWLERFGQTTTVNAAGAQVQVEHIAAIPVTVAIALGLAAALLTGALLSKVMVKEPEQAAAPTEPVAVDPPAATADTEPEPEPEPAPVPAGATAT